MNRYQFLKRMLCDLPGGVFIVYGFIGIFLNGVYGYVNVPGTSIYIHAFTCAAMGSVYMLTCKHLKYLPLTLRCLSSGALLMMSLSLYDFIWGLLYFAVNGDGFPNAGLLSLNICTLVVAFLDSRRVFIKMQGFTPFLLMAAGFTLMVFSGFFTQMSLYNVGLASDPNPQIGWLVSKTGAVLLPLWITGREKHECTEPMLVI